MVTTDILNISLFDEFKPPFEASDFEDEILTAEVQRAIFEAHDKAYQKAIELRSCCTDITCAGVMHDCTHHYLEHELSLLGFEFTADSIGNSRALFTKGNYVFILKKKDAPTNPTSVSKNLREQNVGKHVITISYQTDALKSEITQIYVQYLRGNMVEYNFVITHDDIWNTYAAQQATAQEVVGHKKPKLKIKRQETV